jgi:hypothetical protein
MVFSGLVRSMDGPGGEALAGLPRLTSASVVLDSTTGGSGECIELWLCLICRAGLDEKEKIKLEYKKLNLGTA